MQGSERTPSNAAVRTALRRCLAACDRALSRYVSEFELSTDNALVQDVVSAMAAVATAIDYLDRDAERRRHALRLVVDVCHRAARTCRHHGLDDDLLACAAACENAAMYAELTLGSTAA